jgi:glycosyltransferase involved in cell wall biosynthesis
MNAHTVTDARTAMSSRADAQLAIGLVGPLPPPSGGMANQTRQLAQLLGQAGMRVELVQTNPPYRPAWIGRIRGVRALFRLLPYVAALWRCAGRVDLFHVMANSGWAWHLLAAPAVWIASARGKPPVVNYRGGEAERFFERWFGLVRPTLRRASAVIVPSLFLGEVFGRRGVRTEIVPNIVDLARFRPAAPRPGRAHLLVARNLEAIYDVPTALRAFALVRAAHPHARLTVAGSGPERAALERLCGALGIAASVRFTGRVDNERMPELYRDAEVLLNPALADNMPNSLLEAMASGVPIVSTNVGGVPHLVEDGRTAVLVAPGEPAAMAAAALRVLEDPEFARRLAAAGVDAAQRHAWPRVRADLFAVYARALGRDSVAPGAA